MTSFKQMFCTLFSLSVAAVCVPASAYSSYDQIEEITEAQAEPFRRQAVVTEALKRLGGGMPRGGRNIQVEMLCYSKAKPTQKLRGNLAVYAQLPYQFDKAAELRLSLFSDDSSRSLVQSQIIDNDDLKEYWRQELVLEAMGEDVENVFGDYEFIYNEARYRVLENGDLTLHLKIEARQKRERWWSPSTPVEKYNYSCVSR